MTKSKAFYDRNKKEAEPLIDHLLTVDLCDKAYSLTLCNGYKDDKAMRYSGIPFFCQKKKICPTCSKIEIEKTKAKVDDFLMKHRYRKLSKLNIELMFQSDDLEKCFTQMSQFKSKLTSATKGKSYSTLSNMIYYIGTISPSTLEGRKYKYAVSMDLMCLTNGVLDKNDLTSDLLKIVKSLKYENPHNFGIAYDNLVTKSVINKFKNKLFSNNTLSYDEKLLWENVTFNKRLFVKKDS